MTFVPTPWGYKDGTVIGVGRGLGSNEVMNVASGYGQVAAGHWAAIAIAAAELVILFAVAVSNWRRGLRRRHTVAALIASVPQSGASPSHADGPPRRGWALIAEAVIARERMSGHIDAATYQARMSALVSDS